MSNKLIKASLKKDYLYLSGRQCYGLDEYIYIRKPKINIQEKEIIIFFYVFLENNDGTLESIKNKSNKKGHFTYKIKDKEAFLDCNNFYVYGQDEWGDISVGVFRKDEYNIITKMKENKDYIIEHIKEWMGYHENEGGTLDMLDMFGDDKIDI